MGAGINEQQRIMQSIHSRRQARLVDRASSRCGCMEQNLAEQQEGGRRVRSNRTSFSALSLVLCAAMVPSAFCTYSSSAEIVASKFRHSIAAENFVAGASKLKKSVSFSCKMDQAVLPGIHKTAVFQDAEYGSNVYTPVHSSSDLAGDRLQSRRLRGQDGSLSSSSTARRRLPSSGDVSNAAPYVYTRLQTQLFPQMRF
jgi:hypothetical protein